MSQTLVIAEKPSVAQAIAKVIGANTRNDGYFSGNSFLVSWCLGHLVGLADAVVYDPKYKQWNCENYPLIPKDWKYTVHSDKKQQFELLKKLMNGDDVDSIVCATDAGREGELIFRNVYLQAGCRKPVKRLWISSMENEAILKGFETMKDSAHYNALYESALARSKADWLVGINGTVLFSSIHRTLLRVGRVQSPVLAMICERDRQIKNFQKEPYWNVELQCGELLLKKEKLNDKAAAEELAHKCTGATVTVLSYGTKEKKENPAALYDLTTLQREANRYLGYTAQDVLNILQRLYERKLCTYPRTDSQYITEDMRESTSFLLQNCNVLLPFDVSTDTTGIDRCINNSKVTDHHAILPTAEILKTDLNQLTDKECNILILLLSRLYCSTSKPYRYLEAVVTAKCKDETFSAKGRTVLDSGWKAVEQNLKQIFSAKEDKPESTVSIPVLSNGQTITCEHAAASEHFTSAPKAYTEDTLLSAMETAGNKDFEKETEKKGLGTPATRANIVEGLIRSGYVERKKKNLLPTEKGIALVELLPNELKSPSMTAEWENALLHIERKQLAAPEFLTRISLFVENIAQQYGSSQPIPVPVFTDTKSIGKCPWCGATVAEGKQSFYCTNKECNFAMWCNNRFLENLKKPLTKAMAQKFLSQGRVHAKGLYSTRTGKSFDADIVLAKAADKNGKPIASFRLDFGQS